MSAMYESALWFDDDHDQAPSNNYSNKKNSKLVKLLKAKNSKVLRYFDLDDTPRSFKPFSIIGSGNNSTSNTNFSNNHNNLGNTHDSTITPTSVSTPYGMKHVAHVDHLSCFGLEHCLQTNDVLLLPRVLKSLEKPQPEFVSSSTAESNNYTNFKSDKTDNKTKTIKKSKSFANIQINTNVSNSLSSPTSPSFASPVTNEPRNTSVDIDSVSTPKSNATFLMDNDAIHQTPATTISSDSLSSNGTIVTSTGTEIDTGTPNVPFKAFAYSRTPSASSRRSVDFVAIPNAQTEASSSPVRSSLSTSSRRASHSTIKSNEKQHQVLTLTSVNKKFNVVSYAHTPASTDNIIDNSASTVDEGESSNITKQDTVSSSSSFLTKGRSFKFSTDKLSKSQSFHILPLPSVSFKDSSIVKSKSMNSIPIQSPKKNTSYRKSSSQSPGQLPIAFNNFIRIPESPPRQTQYFTSSSRSSINLSKSKGNNNSIRSHNSIDSQSPPQPPNFSSSIPPSVPSRETLPFIHTASFNSRVIVEETTIVGSETQMNLESSGKIVDVSQGSPSLKDFEDAESKLSTPFTESADSSSTESIVDHKEQEDPFLGHQIKQTTRNSHSQSKEKHQIKYQTGNQVSKVEYLHSDDIDNYEMMGTAEAVYQTHYSPTNSTYYQHNSIAEVSDESSISSDDEEDEMEVIKKNGSVYNINSKKVLSSSNWQKLEDGFNQVSELLASDKSTN